MKLKEEILSLENEVIGLRRDFHMHPELGRQEHRTSQIIESYLQDLGIETTRIHGTGVVGILRGAKPGKTILLRADMDALPITEENDIPYKSQTEGLMHACGHDAHTSMLMVAAKVLAAHKDELCGTVKFVFQPDEEGASDTGAAHMIAGGVLENPKVDASFSMHIFAPLQSGLLGLAPGATWSEMYSFRILLKGKGGHTAAPHEAIDPILCAAAVVQSVQAIQTREISLRDTTVIMFGTIHGGIANNVIPDSVELTGSMRYMYDGSDDSPQNPRKRFERMVRSVAEAYRVEAEIDFDIGCYAVVNDPDFVDFLKNRVLNQIVEQSAVVPYSTMTGEDFSEFLNRNNVPGALMFLGTGSKELGTDYPQHSPKFNINEKDLVTGVEVFVRTAMEFLKGTN